VPEGRERRAVEPTRARRNQRVRTIVALIALVPAVALIVANRIGTAVPAPVWTPGALRLPSELDNGWTPIARFDFMTTSGVNLDPIDKFLAASRGDASLVELGGLLGPARAVAGAVRKQTEICHDAFAHERMVVPCLSVEAGACTTEPLEICARLAMFAALDDASRGLPSAADRMSNVLGRLTDAAANSPHPWMQARSLVLLRQAIHHAATIIKWRRVNVEPLRQALRSITETSLPTKHFVIASYLLKHLALRKGIERADSWLLDEGSTMRGLNAPFAVAAAGGPLPSPPDHTEGLFWWFFNPVGKKLLDALRPGADDDYRKTIELRASVLKRRDEALALQ
jgi:hypothetical protein